MGTPGFIEKIVTARRRGAQFSFRAPLTLNLRKLTNLFSLASTNHLEARLSSHAEGLLRKINNNIPITSIDIAVHEGLIAEFSHRPSQNPQVGEVKGLLDGLLTHLKASANLPTLAEGATAQVAIQAEGFSPAFATQEAAVRGQVLDAQNLNINLELSLDLLIATAKEQNVPLQDMIGTLAVETNFKASSPAMAIFGRLAVSLAVGQMVDNISDQINSNPKVTREALKTILRDTIAVMAQVLGKTNTIIEAKIGKTKIPVKVPAGPAKAKQNVPKHKSINTVSVKTASISKESEVIKASGQLISSRLWETRPLLTKIIAAAIEQNPDNKAEIAKFVAAVLNGMDPAEAESVAQELVRSLDIETATLILPHAPAAMLPVLISQHAQVQTTSTPIKEAIETAIQEFARSEAGQTHVLQTFAEGHQEILTSTTLGQQTIVESFQALFENAQSNPGSTQLNLNNSTPKEQLLQVARLVTETNLANIAKTDVTVQTATPILNFAAQSHRVLRSIVQQDPDLQSVLPQAATTTSTPTAQTTPINARAMVSQLITSAESLGLTMPQQFLPVIGSYIATVAGLKTPNKQGLPVPQDFQVPHQQSAQTSTMQAIVNALEAQAEQALPEVTRGQTFSTTASAIAAELLVYGLILKRVKGDLDKTRDIIEALEKRGLLNKLVTAIEKIDDEEYEDDPDAKNEYNVDDVDDFIHDVTTAIRLHKEGKLSTAEMINRIIELKARINIPIPIAA